MSLSLRIRGGSSTEDSPGSPLRRGLSQGKTERSGLEHDPGELASHSARASRIDGHPGDVEFVSVPYYPNPEHHGPGPRGPRRAVAAGQR